MKMELSNVKVLSIDIFIQSKESVRSFIEHSLLKEMKFQPEYNL